MFGSAFDPGAARRPAATIGLIAAVAAVGIALTLLALAPLGFRLGWWGFDIALFTIIPASAWTAAVAVVIAIGTLALARSRLGRWRLAVLLAVLAVGVGLVYLPLHYGRLFQTFPPINDIATDTADRPPFEATLAAREAESADREDTPEPELSTRQKASYPDLAPVYARLPVSEAFKAALAAAKAMPRWTIVAADPDRGRIEASVRTRWFGFTDDVVIRVRPDGGGSRIDMRSASRIGGHDMGVNAARIRAFMGALRSALPGGQ